MGCTRTPLRLLVAATLVNIVLIIEVPQIESQRVGSETHVRKWVMLDEINTDILERSYVLGGTPRPCPRDLLHPKKPPTPSKQ
ncbi:MAG: hypothetical protein HEP69_17355, partial [Aestuariivita sp.]|nr:hypothetical protein [Aestuariivita sp.]